MVPVLAPILAPYITGGIATLGAGLYAAQPYIQKAVDDYINRSVTPTGEGGIVDAYSDTQTGLQDWTTAYGQDELPPGTLGYVEGVHGPKSKATEELEEMMKKPPIHHPPPEFKIPPTEIPQEEKWTPPVSPPIEVPTTETFPLPEPKTMEDYIVYNKIDPSDVRKVSKDDYFLLESEATDKVKLSPGSDQLVDTNHYMIQSERVGDAMQINAVKILPEYQNQGLGKELYKEAIDDAFKKNLDLVSDNSVSESALRVYKSLENEGFNVIYNKDVFKRGSQILSKDRKQPVVTIKKPVADVGSKLDERSKPVLDAVSKGFENYIAGGKNPDDLSIEAFGEFYLGKKDLIKAKDKKLYNFNERYAKLDSESIAQLPDKFEKGKRKSSKQLTKDQAIERRNFIINNLKNSGNPSVVEYFNSFENDVAAFDNLMGEMRSYRDKTGKVKGMFTLREEKYLPRIELIHEKFGKQIKNGEIDFNDAEELLDIASTLGVDPNTASKDIYRYIQMHAGLFEVPGFETKNRKLDPLIGAEINALPRYSGKTKDAFNVGASDGYYNKKIGVELFGSEFGYRDLREPLINHLKKINNQEGREGGSRLELDEIFSRATLVQNGMEEYAIFVQPLEQEINSKSKANQIDQKFGNTVIKLGKIDKLSREEFNKTIADYNSYKKAFAEEHPDVFVPTFVYGQFTKNEQKMLREQFPDLADRFIKSAEEKGYHFKIDKNFKNVYDFAQGGRVGYKEGGSVKPKINPADYIEYYSDGTKLYKINSFLRDIARQIDY